jgi:hypothetical protein
MSFWQVFCFGVLTAPLAMGGLALVMYVLTFNATEVNEDTPAILMSATPFPPEMIDQHGTIRFLSKPVDPQLIRQILHSVAQG